MLRFAIPEYRLPREVVRREVELIERLGVKFVFDTRIGIDLPLNDLADRFDSVFISIGTWKESWLYLPGTELRNVHPALPFLESSAKDENIRVGRRVTIIGGGNAAIDAARTALRSGAEAIVVYRRDRARMPAHEFEVEEAEEEGVMMRWLSTIKRADEGEIEVERMELDEAGFPQPTGELEHLGADSVVLALGQESDLGLVEGVAGIEVEDGIVRVGADMMTGHPGIFAGGDMVPAERTVTVAIGHGKRAARHIDAWLRASVWEEPPEREPAGYEQLNTWYYADAPRSHRARLEVARRTGTFDEVVHGLDAGNALLEARRCLSCVS
jgi:NADPH-dependent glutamate synthase beta subunit-like oxidoreductase